MFYQGEIINAERIEPSIRDMVAETLQASEEEIDYVFVEYDGECAVLSAETENQYAIIHCPIRSIDKVVDYAFEAEWLIDDLIRESMVDHALATGNKALFEAVMAYRQTPLPKDRRPDEEPVEVFWARGQYDTDEDVAMFDDPIDFDSPDREASHYYDDWNSWPE